MSRPARLRLRILATTLLLASAARAGAETGEELRFFRSLEADGLHAVAAGQMETWLAAHPDDPARTEVEHLLGRSYEAQGDTRRMLRWLARFAADAPEDPRAPEALFAAGRAAVADSLPADAESVLERLLRDHADSARREDALLLLARLRADEGRGAEARQLLGLVIQQTGDAGLLGQALWARAALRDDVDPDGARADRERLMASLPRDSLAVEAALRVAADRRATGDDAAARKALDWALDRSQDAAQQARALRSRAALSADAGRPADAARDLATLRRRLPAAQLSPDDLTREIELLLAADKPRDAVARARERVADAPSAAHLALLARAEEAAGRADDALATWADCAAADPAGELGLLARRRRVGLLLAGAGPLPALERGVEELLPWLGDPLERAEVLHALGAREAALGHPDAARRAWSRVAEDAPPCAPLLASLLELGGLAEERGDWDAARAHYGRLLRQFGGSAEASAAATRLDVLSRFTAPDRPAALEALLALLDEERARGAARGRDFRVGLVLLDTLKDFPGAMAQFDALGESVADAEGRAWAWLYAGRAAAREAERRALPGTRQGGVGDWRGRARERLRRAEVAGLPRVSDEAARESLDLALAAARDDAERRALLDAALFAHGDDPRWARARYRRASLTDPAGADSTALVAARADAEGALALDPSAAFAPAARLLAGRLALAQGDASALDAAERQFRRLVDREPSGVESALARLGLGEVEEARGRQGRAIDHYRAFLETALTGDARARCLLHLGDCHYALREWDAASEAYALLVDMAPPAPLADAARYRVALVAERRGDVAAAREAYCRLLDDAAPRYRREAAWRLADHALAAGDSAAAEDALRRLQTLGDDGPHAAEGALRLARLLLARGEGGEARRAYDALLARGDAGALEPTLRAERVRALLLAGDAGGARKAWAALGDSPDARIDDAERARVLLAFGEERAAAGDVAAALTRLEACAENFPATDAAPAARFAAGLLKARRGDGDGALADFLRVARDAPASPAAPAARRKAAALLFARGDYAAASDQLEACVAGEASPDADLLYNSALALEKREDREGTLARLEQFLARYPEDRRAPEAMMKAAYSLHELGRHEQAVLAYQRAEIFQDDEGKARLTFWVGDSLEALGRRDAALGAFLKVGYLYGDQGLWGVTATLRAAFLYERSGALDEARQLYARVLANQGPDSDPGRSAAEALRRLDALARTDTAGQGQ
ncbi:MAG: tetratricopeptide repeat protein [Candidatus Latescibacteria bacterium]|nr:tetratricopeptide repeat protein [Candidatus Latescibacterota bacterium]